MPVSVYYGDESYLLEQAVKRLRANVVDPAMAGLSHRVFENPKIHEVLESVGAVAFSLGGMTLFEIQGVPWLQKAASTADEAQLEELKTLLKTLDPAKHVLFVSDKANKTVKFSKWLAKLPGVDWQEFKQLAFWEGDKAVQLLMQQAKHRGIQISAQAAHALVDNMGVALQPLFNEIEKLSVYTGGKPIELPDVRLLSNHNENTFAMLGDWVRCKNRAEVFRTLDELLLKQHPVQLFSLIQTYLNNLFQLRLWQQLGYSQASMAERSKKHPFKIKMDLQEYASVPFARLAHLKKQTLEMEWRSKTGDLPPRLALEMLLGA